jgi:uncharacterized glyoxalase superfamily protein PhnB
MQATTARLSRVAPELPATDLQASIVFYVQQLGFKLAMQMEGYAIVERDGIALHLFDDSGRKYSSAGIHIFTPDLDELFAEFATHDARIVQPIETKPWGNREFRVIDAAGNELKFTELVAE